MLKLRGGYYPRIFFPGLYNAKERFFKNFETVYYLKALPGGWIFKASASEDWQVTKRNSAALSVFAGIVDCCAIPATWVPQVDGEIR